MMKRLNKHVLLSKLIKTWIVVLFCSSAIAQTPDANGIFYVKPTPSGDGSGNSWANATNDISGIMFYAGSGNKVFMSVGTYNAPMTGFTMRNNVEMYGGFDPDNGIVNLSQNRILPTSTTEGTVWSGQGTHRVINNDFNLIPALTTSAILDGVTIKNGLTNSGNNGAGIYNRNASPTFRNIVIRNNNANGSAGGAVYNDNASPEFFDVLLLNNSCAANQGTFHNVNTSAPILTNVVFKGNANYLMYSNNSSPTLINSLMVENTSATSAVYSIGGGITHLYNVTILNINTLTSALIPAVTVDMSGNINVRNSILYDGSQPNPGSPNVQYSLQYGNLTTVPPTAVFVDYANSNYALRYNSPAINTGSNTEYPGLTANTKDLAGNPRVFQFNNGGTIDCGAYEFCILPDGNGITYVKPTSTGTGTGDSWANATANLQGAIDAPNGTKVFVAIGNFNAPFPGSFVMRNNLEIYGGFDPDNGITSLIHNRILPSATVNRSVLNGQNQISVIRNEYTSGNPMYATAILDGFTVANGNRSIVGYGGGISLEYASPTLRNIVIRENTATNGGGGMGLTNSSPVMTNIQFLSNTTNDGGGGMLVKNNSNPSITNVIFKGNTATNTNFGSALATLNGCSPTLTNALFYATANATLYTISATNNGGGTGITTLNNVSVFTPSSAPAGCVPAIKSIDGATVKVNNSIIYGLISNSTGGTTTQQFSQLYANTTSVSPSTMFTDPSNGDLTLKVGAPAIDAGSNALFPGLSASSTDLAGNARVHLFGNGGIIDLGPYESNFLQANANGVIYVKPTATGNGNGDSWANATSDLQGAIDANGTQKVFVATGNYIAPTTGFRMKNNVEIYGGFQPINGNEDLSSPRYFGTILNGNNANRVVNNDFLNTTALNNTAILDNVSIYQGKVTDEMGAGMFNQNASPTLINVSFTGNNAEGTTGAGGAMANVNNSSPSITGGLTTVNTATYRGGAIYNEAGSNPTFNTITFYNNSCTNGSTLYSNGSSTTITNAKIYGNFGTNLLQLAGSSDQITLNNVTVANNTQINVGAPVNVFALTSGSTGTINNSIVFGAMTGSGSFTSFYSFIEGNITTTNGNINTTGYSINNIFNNASAGNYTLKGTSPTVNAGSNSLFPGLNGNSKDLEGNPRVIGSSIDMGAIEFVFTPSVSNIAYVKTNPTGLGNGSSWANAMADLQGAIDAPGTQQVFVAIGNYDVPSPNSFVMKDGVEIYGGFDPDNGITELTHNRILPGIGGQGSVLDGKNERPIIWNFNNGVTNSAKLDGFTLTNATGPSNRGCIFNFNASPTLTNLLIKENAITGIYGTNSSSLLTNVSITNNTGEGVHFDGIGNAVLSNVTIAENTSNALYASNTDAQADFSVLVKNSIIFGTVVNPLSQASAQYSLIENDAIPNNISANGASATDIFTDITSGDFTLKGTSPAVNTGSNVLFVGLNTNSKDLAGNARLNGTAIDLGAYEFFITHDQNGISYVKTVATGKGDGSSWANATENLQEAINATGTQKVFVAIGNYDVPSPNSFVMKDAVEIYGGFDPDNGIADLTDNRIMPGIGGQGSILNGKNERPIVWNVNNGVSASAKLDGFELTNAAGTSDQGCIVNKNTSPTLSNLLISNNSVSGIYNENNSSTITNVAITQNTGVGAYFMGEGNATMTNVTIAGNNSAMYAENAYPLVNFSVTVNNGIIYGGISNQFDQLSAHYSLVENDALPNSISAIGITESQVFTDATNGNYTLNGTSPAIDAGSNALFTGLNTNSRDLSGHSRQYGVAIDLGAYEAACSSTIGVDVQTACASFTWIDGITYSESNTTATFTIIGGATSGCDSIVTLNLTIPNIDKTVSVAGNVLTANQNGATYQWIDCNNNNEPIAGAINQVFEPTQTGDYAVIITEGSCSEQSDCIHVETLGMDEVMTNKWNIYPNPVQDKLFIASDVTSTITLYDVTGKIILSTIIHSGVEAIDVNSLTPGVYVIKSNLGNVSKFVKK